MNNAVRFRFALKTNACMRTSTAEDHRSIADTHLCTFMQSYIHTVSSYAYLHIDANAIGHTETRPAHICIYICDCDQSEYRSIYVRRGAELGHGLDFVYLQIHAQRF